MSVTWHSAWYSPTRELVQVIEVDTPARLRELVLRLRADARVEHYRYERVRRWDTTGMPKACRNGHTRVHPHVYQVFDCQCGHGHARVSCYCGDRRLVPPLGPGCEPVPGDTTRP